MMGVGVCRQSIVKSDKLTNSHLHLFTVEVAEMCGNSILKTRKWIVKKTKISRGILRDIG